MKSKAVLVVGLLMFVALYINAAFGQQNSATDRAVAKVQALPEVKAYITVNTQNRPQILVAKTPDNQFKYYWIKVGLGDLDIFRTAYNFYIDAKTYQVYFVDFMVNDNDGMAVISIDMWRALRKQALFNEMHYYRNGKIYKSP